MSVEQENQLHFLKKITIFYFFQGELNNMPNKSYSNQSILKQKIIKSPGQGLSMAGISQYWQNHDPCQLRSRSSVMLAYVNPTKRNVRKQLVTVTLTKRVLVLSLRLISSKYTFRLVRKLVWHLICCTDISNPERSPSRQTLWQETQLS